MKVDKIDFLVFYLPTLLSEDMCRYVAVASQVITSRCLVNKNAQSIALKIAVQINCKLGGSPWTVDIPMKGTMIVGFDVTTDTMCKNLSYGALVATLDSKLSHYFSAVSAHKNAEEASENLAVSVLRALHKYKLNNQGQLPARIIVYRDGVGDGQIPYIIKHEVSLLQVSFCVALCCTCNVFVM
jgi:aubergine-like protein